MKKFLTLALAVGLAGMASAVSMKWSTASAIKFNGSNLKSDGTVTGYLIALDSFADKYDVLGSFSAADIGTKVDEKTGTSAMSKLQNSWTIDTSNYSNGDTFAVLLKYTGASDGKTYWNLSSGLLTMAGMDDGSGDTPPNDANDVSAAFSFAKGTDGTLTAGGGWVAAAAVPEPGVACMALLGIGMMIKRRRA